MLCKTPVTFFLVAGSSEGYTKLNALDGSLLAAGIGNTNLVKITSIIPPYCREIEPIKLPLGALIPVSYESITSNIENEIISAAVAVALPKNKDAPGLITEYSERGKKDDIEKIAIQMAEEGMKIRNEEVGVIRSISAEHKVKKTGAALAAVILWY